MLNTRTSMKENISLNNSTKNKNSVSSKQNLIAEFIVSPSHASGFSTIFSKSCFKLSRFSFTVLTRRNELFQRVGAALGNLFLIILSNALVRLENLVKKVPSPFIVLKNILHYFRAEQACERTKFST